MRNIRELNHSLTIHSNTGSTKTAWMGDLPGLVPVCFHKNVISNILLLAKVSKRYRVKYGSNGSNPFEVHTGDGEVRSFVDSNREIFYLDIIEELKKKVEHATALFQTVENNASRYNKRDYLKAVQARKL